jgi:hypothetical protein
MFSALVSNDIKIKISKITILPVVLYACETWTLALMEEHILRVFEFRMLRKILGDGRQKVTEAGENCIMRGFTIFSLHQILLGKLNQGV